MYIHKNTNKREWKQKRFIKFYHINLSFLKKKKNSTQTFFKKNENKRPQPLFQRVVRQKDIFRIYLSTGIHKRSPYVENVTLFTVKPWPQWRWDEKWIWYHICCWWLFDQWDPSTAILMEEVCGLQGGYVEK